MANETRMIDANALEFTPDENGIANNIWIGGRNGGKTMELVLSTLKKMIEDAPTIDALPIRCHIGDTVWIVGTKCMSGLYEEECDTYIHYGECDCHLAKEYTVFRRKVDGVMFLYLHDLDENALFRWGETVFKTQEEAEAALAKMKEADHGK